MWITCVDKWITFLKNFSGLFPRFLSKNKKITKFPKFHFPKIKNYKFPRFFPKQKNITKFLKIQNRSQEIFTKNKKLQTF